MEFLQGADDDEIDSSSKGNIDAVEEGSKVAAVMSKWIDGSDDDDDDDDSVGNVPVLISRDHTGYLPRADDLFTSIIPQFSLDNLRSKSDEIIKSKKYVPTEPTVIPIVTTEKKKGIAAVVLRPLNEEGGSVDSRKPSLVSKSSSSGSTVKGATPKPLVPKQKEMEKDTAKDRVKRQRLSGQSGIGADFKTWKSDEEMRQRQQYD